METIQLADGIHKAVERAAGVLRSGGVILYPTDTLYGLGSNAFSDEAVAKVYAIKSRDERKPIHCVVADLAMAEQYAEVNDTARKLAEKFLPGPLTLVLKKKQDVGSGIAKNIEAIGIRIPNNEFCLSLAKKFGPYTTTSANVAGAKDQRSVHTILSQLGERAQMIDLVIDAGELPERKPSTVVDVSSGEVRILREGAISKKEILEASDLRAQPAFDALRSRGIEVDLSTFERHPFQGYMSEVYTLRSNIGRLVVHVMRITHAQEHIRAWEKLVPLSRVVRSIQGVPVSEVIFSQRFSGYFVVVQKFLEGENLGRRAISLEGFDDTWGEPREAHLSQLVEIIAKFHQAPVSGFGWLRADGDGIKGEYPTWSSFLDVEIPYWIQHIEKAEEIRKSSDDGFLDLLQRYIKSVRGDIEYDGPPRLVHGDLTNPSNILVKDGRVTGIVDWEYSMAGDPAWEFAVQSPYSLDEYFRLMPELQTQESQERFKRRRKIYSGLAFVLWLYTHSWNPEGELYRWIRSIGQKRFSEALG